MTTLFKVLVRKKVIATESVEETGLSRVLNTFDLTALGVGSTLGVGVYVLAGHVAKDVAGPAVVLSFLLAAVASVFAGLCYAEFGARVPRAGSAYIYSYVCVGEFVAFVIGWNLILEYVIGSASVARGLSSYLDTLINNTLQDTFRDIAPINIPYLSSYFDFFSFGISIVLSVALAFGLKESSMANNIFTTINIFVVLFVIIAGSLKADPNNWNINPANVTANSTEVGKGGFFPFGVEGMIKGAATCFYGFVGFDCIATTGEEVKNPKKAIPISIIMSLAIIFLAYFGTSTVITLMVPYYLQNPNAPIPHAFDVIGWEWAKWIVAIGAIFGLCASLFGAMFPLPRIIYAMGSDGLVFRFLAKVHPRFQTPVVGTLLAGLLTGLMSALFELKQLVNMMSIGTLLAYTLVAASVLLLRYENEEKHLYAPIQTTSSDSEASESGDIQKYNDKADRRFSTNNADDSTTSDDRELVESDNEVGPVTCCKMLGQIFNFSRKSNPTNVSQNVVAVEIFIYCILCVLIGLTAIYWNKNIVNGEIWAITVASVIVGITAIVMMSLVTQPTSKKKLSFKVPFVPLIPALSILINVYLMLMLDNHTWIRFGVWMAIGIPMYILCVRHSCRDSSKSSSHNYSNNITSSNANKSNGITNVSFVYDKDQQNTLEKRKKSTTEVENNTAKKGPAPLPPVQPKNETISPEVHPETVIAQLDEILEHADDNLETNLIHNNRKLSFSTLSNTSEFVEPQVPKSVVVDVHCNGDMSLVSTPVVTSNAPPPLVSVPDNSNDKSDKVAISSVIVPRDVKKVSDSVQNKSVNDEDLILVVRSGDIDSVNNKVCDQNLDSESAVSKEDLSAIKDDSSLITVSLENREYEDNESGIDIDSLGKANEEKYGLGSSEQSSITAEDITKKVSEEAIVSFEDATPTVAVNNTEIPLQKSVSDTLIPAPPSPPDHQPDIETSYSDMSDISTKTVSKPSTPTELTLRSVTLRKTPKREVEKPVTDVPGSDRNLKVGSVEYNSFLAKLNNKLQSNLVTPTYLPAMVADQAKIKRALSAPKEDHNENVIEDKIDQQDAREKLKLFYANNYNNPYNEPEGKEDDNIYEEFSVAPENNSEPKNIEENSHIVGQLVKKVENSSHDNDNDNKGLVEHRDKMQNVFRSMNLKKIDSTNKRNEETDKTRRLSKTLGTSFKKKDDKVEHRQKMDDVFQNILLMRKDSMKEKDKSNRNEVN